MAAGTITWFDEGEDYGYITQDDGEAAVVVRGRDRWDLGRALAVGDRVEFGLDRHATGAEASGVRVIGLPAL
ncbi:MAG TPA: cold shock domain-containing protein [Nocardioides sp.]